MSSLLIIKRRDIRVMMEGVSEYTISVVELGW